MVEQLDVFAKNYLVSGLDQSRIEEIAAIAQFETMLAGDDVTVKGQRSTDLVVVLEGIVNIYTPHGDKIAEAGPGSVIGEISLVDDQPRSATATCVGLTKLARLPGQALRRYMATNKDVGFVMLANLARVLAMRLRQTDAAMENLFDKSKDAWEHSI